MKKIILGLTGFATALAVIPMFAAFEAHVINVTARIENALSVPAVENGIHFGTVFPQEALDRVFDVSLSQSFIDEDRVDDVTYMLRQKPKCWNGDVDNPVFGLVRHVVGAGTDPDTFECVDDTFTMLPLLCPYLSKHELTDDGSGPENDDPGIPAFHGPIVDWNMDDTMLTQLNGKLIKSLGDLRDEWLIDLKVPCFGNHCAQDWASFVQNANDNADPNAYIQPIENEHKLFGCDLWLEVTGISLPGGRLGCNEKVDVSLVLDRSGSISAGELTTLKTAAKAFVDALALSTDGAHAAEVSFSNTATLDQELTDDATAVKSAIDALVAGGLTNLEDALLTATAELASVRDRADATSPDFIVLITDGAPTASNGPGTNEEDAKAAADAAKAAGIEIYVVGVGTSGPTATFLRDDIASGADHYFDASDFGTLQTLLEGLVSCPS